jgi:ribose 1,5-bisphosphate isomerase
VTHILDKASKAGKKFKVICTETRPLLQGRITAKEMLDLGIETSMIIDSATRCFIKKADIVIVGADAISAEGNVINKIGTATIAALAQEARVPFYVVTELLKFDPATLFGDFESIEERNRNEIWKEAPAGLAINNPAFEVVRRDFIHGIICEEGIIPPHSVYETVVRKYPWIFT